MLDGLLMLLPSHPALHALLVVAGLALLVFGADVLVEGAKALALRLGIDPLVVGLTVVAFGTSAPELFTSVAAALRDAPGLAVGNVVGSNIANVALILGLTAAVRPIPVERMAARRDLPVMVVVSFLASLTMIDDRLGRVDGALLVLGLLGYIAMYVAVGRTDPALRRQELEAVGEEAAVHPEPVWRALAKTVIGIGMLSVGSEGLVFGATGLATWAGVPELVIGLTIVAFGTSLPELATSLRAAMKAESGIAVGNVLGSNVFNLLGVLGVTALVAPIDVPEDVLRRDLWVMLAIALAAVPIMLTGGRISRWQGSVLAAAYVAYIVAAVVG